MCHPSTNRDRIDELVVTPAAEKTDAGSSTAPTSVVLKELDADPSFDDLAADQI